MEVRALLVLVVVWVSSPVQPFPTARPNSTLPNTQVLKKTAETTGGSSSPGGSSSLWETVLRLDQMLQRPNDYNALMLESGEEDDQLSRLLYKLQEKERLREERLYELEERAYMMSSVNVPFTNNLDMIPQRRIVQLI
nr:uncharacterized protein LOC123771796 isoform X1 [Procambarus clarkii]